MPPVSTPSPSAPSSGALRAPEALRFHPFDGGALLIELCDQSQGAYLRNYLLDLGATWILEEPYYFDRDYLAEFSEFYSQSARGYPNVCRRLHFFEGPELDRESLLRALSSEARARELQEGYLGFAVIRPIPAAPFGKTALRWYPNRAGVPERVIAPCRDYTCHLAGISLSVSGLAWQQQDCGVGRCATIALWSLLHSSAFDEYHAVPTTAEITRSAHRTASLGSRVFPTDGLTIEQVLEAIKEHDLAPMVVDGTLEETVPWGRLKGFDRARFCGFCATFVRSGYTMLLVGQLATGILEGHSVCMVGFRPGPPGAAPHGDGTVPADAVMEDLTIEHVYIHDDNLGPGVRFRIHELSPGGIVVLVRDPPQDGAARSSGDPSIDYPPFIPQQLITAVPHELRLSSEALYRVGMQLAQDIGLMLGEEGIGGVSFSIRFVRLRDYLSTSLRETLGEQPELLARTRLALVEDVPPMSLYLGVVRIGIDSVPCLELLHDTTDSESNTTSFAHIVLDPNMEWLLDGLLAAGLHRPKDLGVRVRAYELSG